MATGDLDDLPDDLQAVADRLTCLGMEMAEHLRDAHRRFPPRPDPTEASNPPTTEEIPMTTAPPEHLAELVATVAYKPEWAFRLQAPDDTCPVFKLMIVSVTPDSFNFDRTIRVRHEFMVPPATYKRDVWAAWLFDRVRDVETHEAGEFFRIDGVREFAPHHSNGEDPYRVWHVSDWATAAKSSGQD